MSYNIDTKLSTNFNLREFVNSSMASHLKIDNTPTDVAVVNLKLLCQEVLEPLRVYAKKKILILSGFRCKELNAAVGGSPNSQHMYGQAADIHIELMTNEEVFDLIKEKLVYDQLILEKVDPKIRGSGWVHVSYKMGQNRQEAFEIKKYCLRE